MPAPSQHSRDPLHGITLAAIVTTLAERHGWQEMADRIPVRCFQYDPSVKSSLTFLRKTPWARQRVEEWFIEEQPEPILNVSGAKQVVRDNQITGSKLKDIAVGEPGAIVE